MVNVLAVCLNGTAKAHCIVLLIAALIHVQAYFSPSLLEAMYSRLEEEYQVYI